ncbi:MAG: NADH-quinone oxidoreductase subunit I [Bacillota bacterium]
MYGKGLLTGLSITLKHLFGKAITQQYPEVKPVLPPNSHGFFDFSLDKCISCGMCAKSCPNNVIELASTRDENNKRKLTSFKMELGYCLFCGLCVEACPTDALNFTTDFELSTYRRDGTIYEFVKTREQK